MSTACLYVSIPATTEATTVTDGAVGIQQMNVLKLDLARLDAESQERRRQGAELECWMAEWRARRRQDNDAWLTAKREKYPDWMC